MNQHPHISENNSPRLIQDYDNFRRNLLIQRAKIATLICICAVPLGILLDYFIYPQFLKTFLLIRIGCELVIILIGGLLLTKFSSRWSRLFGCLWVVPMIAYDALMIALSDGFQSPYYIGIATVIIGGCLLLPWNLIECAWSCLTAFLFFLISGLTHFYFIRATNDPYNFGLVVINIFFLGLFFAICLISSHFAERLRFHDFRLQFELDQQRGELERSYQQLTELDQVKNKFFANISHELRTPLTLILSPLDALRTRLRDTLNHQDQETLQLMYDNALRLYALIDDLLDLVRLEQGKMKYKIEPIKLRELLPGLTSAIRAMAESHGIRVSINLPEDAADSLQIHGDRRQIEKVFLNLFFNAIKFTPKGGVITVTAARIENEISVTVQDTGIGISESDLKFIFQRFWQVDGTHTRHYQGTGIGLALVKEIIDLHHGKIAVKSTLGQGTSFIITLTDTPMSDDEIDDPPADETKRMRKIVDQAVVQPARRDIPVPSVMPPSTTGEYRHKLLIVDDEPDMQKYLQYELSPLYDLMIAPDGEIGFELTQKNQPEIILLDFMLPKIDGITLCRKIKNNPHILPTKIILLTAKVDDQTKLDALNAQVDDFITKPFSIVELKIRLKNMMLASQLERQLHLTVISLNQTLVELREKENQLLQSGRLSALGSMAAGIMHEINNPLNYNLMAVSYLLRKLKDADPDIVESITDIESGLRRIQNIIKDLKGFAYGGENTAKEEITPGDMFNVMQKLLSEQLTTEVQLQLDIDDHSVLYGNKNQLIQLLVNLVQNAVQATAENPAAGKSRMIRITMKPTPTHYLLAVWDNGKGISAGTRAKIFDPFFTTKSQGQGMGLGLSISHTIVKNHSGEIEVKSVEGVDTEFIVKLPLTYQSD